MVRLLGISLAQDELPGSALPEHWGSDIRKYQLMRMGRRPSIRRNLKRPRVGVKVDVVRLGEKVAEVRVREQTERYKRNCNRIRQVFDQLTNHSCKMRRRRRWILKYILIFFKYEMIH